MTHYRFYLLDRSGKVQRGTSLQLSDDSEAFARALELSHQGAVEVWESTRKVCFIDQNAERKTG